jgi:hypothetical protein
MKLALLATLVTFAGSIAGFQVVTASGDAGDRATATPAGTKESIVLERDRDCPAKVRDWEV